MWTGENRGRYDRSKLRYPSDLTDEEWSHVEPLLPPEKHGGAKRTVNLREVVNGLLYVLSTGCQWRAIPKDLPPKSTVYDYFNLWDWDGTLDRIHATLYAKCREAAVGSHLGWVFFNLGANFSPATASSVREAGQCRHGHTCPA